MAALVYTAMRRARRTLLQAPALDKDVLGTDFSERSVNKSSVSRLRRIGDNSSESTRKKNNMEPLVLYHWFKGESPGRDVLPAPGRLPALMPTFLSQSHARVDCIDITIDNWHI
jgi:hypothetical protein